MTRYLFSAYMSPRDVEYERASGPRRSTQELLDLVDTSDPAWPSVAAVLREFTEAGIELDAATIPMAVKLGKLRCPVTDAAPSEGAIKLVLAAGADSIVYYVLRGGLIKIGATVNPAQRFADLLPDEILAIEPGTSKQEALRHRQFAHLRCGGEYFRDAQELRDHIARIRSFCGEPDPAWPTSATARRLRNPWRLPSPTSTEAITAMSAEAELGINESTLRGWVHRGRIQRAGRDERGRHTFYREHLIILRDNAEFRRITRVF